MLVTLCLGIPTLTLWADRGSIPYRPDVSIFEPNQRAMIAWNGEEEILLLSTEVSASAKTEVLEVLPLPAEPEVKKGDIKTFERATKLIYQKLKMQEVFALGRGTITGKDASAGEVTFEAQIGAHHVSVVKVLKMDDFVQWVIEFLKDKGVKETQMSEGFRQLIEVYLKDKYHWFVFDVIKVSEEAEAVEPLQYTFKTNQLFYPLRITSLAKGKTIIDIIVLTPKLLSKFPALSVKRINLRHEPVEITQAELKGINEDMTKLLEGRGKCMLRIWRCQGKLAEFEQDLLAQE